MTPLHHLGEFFRSLLLLVPLEVVRAVFIAVPLGLLLWVLWLPREQTSPPAGAAGPLQNLKLWAALALLFQALIYLLL